MTRIILWLASTIASLVLLFGYPSSTTGPASSVQVAAATPGMEASAQGTGTGVTATTNTAATYTGRSVSTRYGPVQVQITADASSVTDVQVLQIPSANGRDKAINDRAVPALNAQVVDGNASDVQMVSGASYTSSAYINSLQSALDQANL
ncbi:MAG: FMN-binding protein [Ornithinimicrobium sp.]